MPSTLERLREHWLDNVGLLVSGALTAAVVLRILAVAHFDVLTAAAILQRGGTTNVLVGAVLASVPSLAAAAVPLITAVVALSQKTTFRAVWVITVFLVLSIILWVLFVPSRLATLVGGSMLATSLLVLVLRRQKDRATEALALEAGAPERDAALVKALSAQGDALASDSDAVAAELEALDALDAAPRKKEAALERIRATAESIQARREELTANLDRVQRRIDRRMALREKEKSLTLRTTRVVVGVMAVLACAILFSSSAVPWLPTERIEKQQRCGIYWVRIG